MAENVSEVVAEVIEDVGEKTNPDETEEVKQEPEKKYTDAQVDEIVNKKYAKYQKQKEEEIDEAKKLIGLTEKEKEDLRISQLEKELETLKNETTFNDMSSIARGLLQESNIVVGDGLLKSLVTSDADTTKENIEEFITLFVDAVDKGVEDRIRSKAPKLGKRTTRTKEDILAIKDDIERQNAIAENIELFS